jgi:KDO2-lipid IV(A) lauroyltransferase
MDWLLYLPALALVRFLQALPLRWVARIGRAGGGLAWRLDARHRRVALRNLEMCLGRERSLDELRALARENFKRIGENYACAVKTAAMTAEQLKPSLQFVGLENLYPARFQGKAPPRIVAIGHFGNFELYARFGQYVPGVQCATTYRALRQPALNRLMQRMREMSDALFFERRTDAEALKAAMKTPGILLGLLLDQHASAGGVIVPFFGRDCSTSASAAIFALRYDCPLHTGICYRVGLAKWIVEAGPEIPTHVAGQARSVEEITLDVNRAFEIAVRRDPANWFWVHNRWKAAKSSTPEARPVSQTPASASDLKDRAVQSGGEDQELARHPHHE